MIAVLIGLVSVTGAVLAWRSSVAGEKATDKDRQAVAETVIEEQANADNEVIFQDAQSRFADHAIAVVNATLLDAQAEQAEGIGDDAGAQVFRDEAEELRAVAQGALNGTPGEVFLPEYVVEGDPRPVLEVDRLRRDLQRISQRNNEVDPAQTVNEANRLRDESEQLDRWLIFMVVAVVLLTLAQINRVKFLRLGLAGAGTAVWLVSSYLAFTGS